MSLPIFARKDTTPSSSPGPFHGNSDDFECPSCNDDLRDEGIRTEWRENAYGTTVRAYNESSGRFEYVDEYVSENDNREETGLYCRSCDEEIRLPYGVEIG